ncbi:MAG: hypothetical protein E4H14_18135 [Candidatus Thorarchaeota archaeon]|nr:MAG: hypothetical protein E4H14_18135 [Candidatus Thorarchaeota archaeon]
MNISNKSRTLLIIVLLILTVLLLPFAYHLDLNPFGWNSYEAVLWRYVESTSSVLLLNNTVDLFPYYAFGFVFIFQVYRYYQNKASRIWTIIAGIYATLHPLLLSLPVILGLPFTIASGGEFMYPVIIPIPFLLLIGVALIYLKPSIMITEPV